MVYEDFKRMGFKEILDILDPDLTCDFKASSFYHNEFRKKQACKKQESSVSEKKKADLIKIADPQLKCGGEFDNYM